MNNLDRQYKELLEHIIRFGVDKKDRTGTGTKSIFGWQIRHNMKEGFPLLTTKKIHFKSVVTELLWFLRGDTNIKYLVDNDCHIWDGDAYKNYGQRIVSEDLWMLVAIGWPNTQEEFINKIKTDDEFAKKWGELGPIYGKQWRKWRKPIKSIGDSKPSQQPIDQISNLINELKTNPDSRRLMVNAWAVHDLPNMVLPPCHYGFQVYTRELSFEERWELSKKYGYTGKDAIIPTPDETFNMVNMRLEVNSIWDDPSFIGNVPKRAISLMYNMRSCDTFLGLPFNIASYGLLLEIIAKEVNMVPEDLIGNLGDVHLYNNHIDQAKEQMGREGYTLPTLPLPDYDMFEGKFCPEYWMPEDFQLENYQSHPSIKAPLSN